MPDTHWVSRADKTSSCERKVDVKRYLMTLRTSPTQHSTVPKTETLHPTPSIPPITHHTPAIIGTGTSLAEEQKHKSIGTITQQHQHRWFVSCFNYPHINHRKVDSRHGRQHKPTSVIVHYPQSPTSHDFIVPRSPFTLPSVMDLSILACDAS
eukprot:scaffold326147_cov139-Cyclotella_meneghiniana.AAC.1